NIFVTGFIPSPTFSRGYIAAVSAETTRPFESASTSITAVQTRVPATAVTVHPLTTPTTIAPTPPGSSGFPVSSVIIIAVAIVLAVMGIVVVHRWWIRRQNPSLFRDF
ncbi:MAG: hypothetical protein WCH85_05445, partial [Methanomicrobiales archaeon]